MQLFKNKSSRGHHCLRLNYKVAGQPGYCHTLRATNLRFFNNVAVTVKNEDEMIESLRAIAETMEVALEVAGLPLVPLTALERLPHKLSRQPCYLRQSDCLQSASPATATLPRNVSETQLSSLKSAGTKALSNMSQQFSKLNRLGQSFKVRRKLDKDETDKSENVKTEEPDQPKFMIGVEEAKECTEEDDDDDVVIAKIDFKLGRQTSTEAYIPNVGIVMSNTNIEVGELADKDTAQYAPNITDVSLKQVVQKDVKIRKHPFQHSSTEIEIDVSKVGSVESPGIVIEKTKIEPPKNLPLDITDHQLSSTDGLDKTRKFSHSSGEVDSNEKTDDRLNVEKERRNSERDVALGISSSQSENALKSIKATATTFLSSPSAVLSPFSKLAKGVQSFGATLDPRKVVEKVGNKQAVSLQHIAEENVKLEERWKQAKCRSRLVAV